MRAYAQWCVWRYEQETEGKPTKVPYHVSGLRHASVTDPSTWATFDEAVTAAPNFAGIGFILTANDPYCFIDLDDTKGEVLALERQKKIHATFASYTELSPSGKGVHIICKGSVPSGRKRAFVEIYSAGRYMTMTGDAVNTFQIEERHNYCRILWDELGGNVEQFSTAGTLEQTDDDKTVYERACSAKNGDKFMALWQGNWQTTYNERTGTYFSSQSEADLALINIITYHTQSRIQIRNLFLQSALGQRPKARRIDYVESMISRSFDRTVPLVDFDGLANQVEEMKAAREAAKGEPATRAAMEGVIQTPKEHLARAYAEVKSDDRASISYNTLPIHAPQLPPGMVADLATYIYEASPRPVPQIALMAALGLMAGITGRAYNVSNSGLNLYMLLLAKTGRGKEAMSSGIDRVLNDLKMDGIPSIEKFVGPGDIASGQALIKYISQQASFVSVIGEFDKLLAGLSSQKANSAMIMLRKFILDAYGKSGWQQTYRPMAYSDTSKNTATVLSPAFSILAECTPEKFFELIDESMVTEGLLPRLLTTEYLGDRVPMNYGHAAAKMPDKLKTELKSIVSSALIMNSAQTRTVNHINFDKDGFDTLEQFNQYCDAEINKATRDAIAQLWNRAHLKALKLSGIVAVGVNHLYPKIDRTAALWAVNYVERDVRNMLSRFESGDIGHDEGKQLNELRRIIAEYVTEPYELHIGRYGVPRKLHNAKVVPMRYLSQRLYAQAAFRKDRLGPKHALGRAVSILLDQAEIVEVPREQLNRELGTTGKSYMVKEMRI
jgi:hypothetical protein